MADKNDIKKAILASVGNPEGGPIAQNIDKMVDAVVGLDKANDDQKPEVKTTRPAKETRIQEASEIR